MPQARWPIGVVGAQQANAVACGFVEFFGGRGFAMV